MESQERTPLCPLSVVQRDENGPYLNTNTVGSEEVEDDDDEVFFGPVSKNEKRKAAKFKRRTEVYKSGIQLLDCVKVESKENHDERTESLDYSENKENTILTGDGDCSLENDCKDDEVDDSENVESSNEDCDESLQDTEQKVDELTCNGEGDVHVENLLSTDEGDLDVREDLQINHTNLIDETSINDEDDILEVIAEKDDAVSVVQEWKSEGHNVYFDTDKTLLCKPVLSENKDLDGEDVELVECSVDKQESCNEADIFHADTDIKTKTSETQETQEMSSAIGNEISGLERNIKDIAINASQPLQNTVQAIQQSDFYIYSSPTLPTKTVHSYPNIDDKHVSFSPMMSPQMFASPVAIAADMVVRKYANPTADFDCDTENGIENQPMSCDGNHSNIQMPNDTEIETVVNTSPYDKTKADMIAYRRQLLAEKRARLAKIRKERERLMKRLEMDLSKTSPSMAECLKVQAGVAVHSISKLPSVTQKLKEVENNSLTALQLDEAELDMVTKLHTMKNRHYNVQIEHQSDTLPTMIDSEPLDLYPNESKVQWCDGMVCEITETCTPSKPVRQGQSILHRRPEGFVYPYSDLAPAPVMISHPKPSNLPSSPYPRMTFN
ncbi:uncharacterized protein LOC144433692 [Glandiceps talaboti]